MSEGAVVLDAEGVILSGNGRFTAMLAKPSGQVIGSSLTHHVTPSDQIFGGLLDRGKRGISQDDIHLINGDGQSIPVHASIAPFESGGLEAFCLILTDLSNRFRSRSSCDRPARRPRRPTGPRGNSWPT